MTGDFIFGCFMGGLIVLLIQTLVIGVGTWLDRRKAADDYDPYHDPHHY